MLVLYYPRAGTIGASPILMTLVPNPFWTGSATGDVQHPFDIDLKVTSLVAVNAFAFAVIWLVARLMARPSRGPGPTVPGDPVEPSR